MVTTAKDKGIGVASSYSQTPHPTLPSKGRHIKPNLSGIDNASSSPLPRAIRESPLRWDKKNRQCIFVLFAHATNYPSVPSMYHSRRAGACSRRRKEYLSAPSMCHPEQAKRVEPQAKRRGGCRVSGRRDLSWSYGIPSLDPTSRYPHRCCYAVRLRAYRPPLRMTHGRCIFVT